MANTTTNPNIPDSDTKSNHSKNNTERERVSHTEHQSHHIITHWIASIMRRLFY